jgi:hypothetical protein
MTFKESFKARVRSNIQLHELILNIKVPSICVLFTFSLIISGLHRSYTDLLGKGFL